MESIYLNSIIRQFEHQKRTGEKAIGQLEDDWLFWQYSSECNSIAILVKHLRGNMLSRWTHFLTTDGEKEWRKRDQEFEQGARTRAELLTHWDEGWNCLFNTLKKLTDEDLEKTVYIRNEKHTVTDAINRHLTHYAYHIGQIVYIAKMAAGQNWKSLSIPR